MGRRKRPPVNPNPLGLPIIWGWNNIASYLGISTKTLITNWKRWRLPLIRLSSKNPSRHLVGILVVDLELWLLRCVRETLEYYLKNEPPPLLPCPPKRAPGYIKALYTAIYKTTPEEAKNGKNSQKQRRNRPHKTLKPDNPRKLLPLFPNL